MLVVVVLTNNYEVARYKIENAIKFSADVIELRLDYFNELNLEKIAQLKQAFSIPMIFTLRKQSQGGLCKRSEKNG
jgi:3-dehydroquinate dehydratase